MAASGVDRGWRLLHLATTTVWLPSTSSAEVLVETTGTRAPGPAELQEWEAGAILPDDRWRQLPPSIESLSARDTAFRIDRDVALLAPGESECQGTPSHDFGTHKDTPGKTCLTVGGEGLRLGLHLDNWDRLPAAERHASRNRVNLNLGPEPRWFMFADLDVVATHPPDVVPTTDSTRELIRRSATPVRVVRLRVPAGWAYIAPTENLVHDAGSEGQREGTRHTSALGRFRPQLPQVGLT